MKGLPFLSEMVYERDIGVEPPSENKTFLSAAPPSTPRIMVMVVGGQIVLLVMMMMMIMMTMGIITIT